MKTFYNSLNSPLLQHLYGDNRYTGSDQRHPFDPSGELYSTANPAYADRAAPVDSTASAKDAANQAAAWESAEAALNRKFSAAEAQKAREWQEYYERNKYRWNMEGMREAGLNPILAYQLMSGGSASSAVAQPTKANIASAYSAEYNRIVGESANAVKSTASILSLITVLGAVLLRAALI